MSKQHPTRRTVLKKALYTAPVLLTLPALPSFAAAGSGQPIEEAWTGGIKILPSPAVGGSGQPIEEAQTGGIKILPRVDHSPSTKPKKKG